MDSLSIGDSISWAIRRAREDLRMLLSLLMVPTIIELVGKMILLWGSATFLASQKSLATLSSLSDLTIVLQALGLTLAGMVIAVPAEIWLTLKQLAWVRCIINGESDYSAAYAKVTRRIWAIVLYWTLFYSMFLAWVLIWAIAFAFCSVALKKALVSSLIMLPIVLILLMLAALSFSVIFMPLVFIFPVMACEDDGAIKTLNRAIRLSFKTFVRTLGFATAVTLVFTCVYFALTSVMQVIYGIEYIKQGLLNGQKMADIHMPMYLQLIDCCWHSLLFIFLMPAAYLATGYYYLSVRAKDDGIDILQAIGKLERSPAES